MNDENCPPQEELNISIESVKAGAAVFGSLVFGNEQIEHSLCYSPSPLVNRRNNNNISSSNIQINNNNVQKETTQPLLEGKTLDFEKPAMSPKKRKEKAPHRKVEPAKNEINKDSRQTKVRSGATKITNNTSKRRVGLKLMQPRNNSNSSFSTIDHNISSVNPVINGVRRSKEENIKEKMLSVAELREHRRLENEAAAAFNAETEKTRREVLELRKQLSERFRRAKLDREHKLRAEHLAKVESEIQFKSKVHVEHRRTLKEMEDARRRMSMNDRAKLRQNHREGKERMKLAAIEEDQALFEERHESSVAMRNTNSNNAEKRRRSFAFRNGDARRIRELYAQRQVEEKRIDHESYELKWAGDRDAEDYQKQMAQERRDSLAFRNAEGARIRDLETQMKSDALHDEHESYELKWAGDRDAEDYQKQMAQERRDSLAFRNNEAARHEAVMTELLSLAREKEHESYILKWAGENDAKVYIAEQEELRRQSLAFRNAEGKRHRDLDAEDHANKVHEQAMNEELNADCQQDVQNYRAECAARDRASLCLRGKEAFANRMRKEIDRQEMLNHDHDSHLLDTAAWQDVNEYVDECKRRKRLSLAFRAKEKRRHFEYAKQQATLAVQRQHRDTQYRSDDARYIEMAKLKEKAQAALKNFNQSPNCSFGSNPFASLLG